MSEANYLQWLTSETQTTWWHDSADPDELRQALGYAATGVTSNPVLTYRALVSHPDKWGYLYRSVPPDLSPEERAEALMQRVLRPVAQMMEPVYRQTDGKEGYVCAQVNPARAWDRETMELMAKRYHSWAPNIAVKLPVTAAGLDVLEDCTAQGITVTATVSFTVPQVVAVAERHRKGVARARRDGTRPGHCFAVIMIGRLDDYLRDVIVDRSEGVGEEDIRQAGLAVTKRAYAIFQERNYDAVLLVAALRGTYHMTELAGAKLIMSIHPKIRSMILQANLAHETGIEGPVADSVIDRLRIVPEFVRSYEPDGLAPEDFITFGPCQRTLTQFSEAGWERLASFMMS